MSSVRFLSITGAAATLITLTSCSNPQTPNPSPPEAKSPGNSSQTTTLPSTATDQQQDVDYMTTLGLMSQEHQ